MPQNIILDFLTSGYSYDNKSVAAAVNQANMLFDRRELRKALEVYGIAYEIGRLHYVYPALMHDLVFRRVLCHSMLGDYDEALKEAGFALEIIPGSPSTYLEIGVIYSKMGQADEANAAFQTAVAQCKTLRDLAETMIALFQTGQNLNDRAIQICTQVLKRSPDCPFALLTRGNAYSFHSSGYYAKQGADDHGAAVENCPTVAEIVGRKFTLERHQDAEELMLRFHPWMAAQAPKPYEKYVMYKKRDPFFSLSLILFAVAKFRTQVQSAHLLQDVVSQRDELQQQRAAAERRMQQLLDSQRKVAALESHTEVWGPADPDHVLVRKYRRYWMERPIDFPRRSDSPGRSRSPGGASRQHQLRPPNVCVTAHRAVDVLCGSNRTAATDADNWSGEPSPETTWLPWPRAAKEVEELDLLATPPCFSMSLSPRTARDSRGDPPNVALVSPASAPVALGPGDALNLSHTDTRAPTIEAAATAAAATPAKGKGMSVRRSLFAAAPTAGKEAFVAKPPPQKLGENWSEHNWLAKALELAELYGGGPGRDIHGDLDRADKSSFPVQLPPPDLDTDGDVYPGLGRVRLSGRELGLAEAIEERGFSAIPSWYGALDRVYEITDMADFSAAPETLVADAGLQGVPGYSYVVPRSASSQRKRGGSTVDRSDEDSEPSAAVQQRYANKLLATSLPGSRGRLAGVRA